MSVTKGFRFSSDEDKNYVLKVINKITDIHKGTHLISVQGDAVTIMAKAYEEGIEIIQLRDMPSSVQGTLDQIVCDFIKWEVDNSGKDSIQGYFCYETFNRKKKPTLIGTDDDLVIERCNVFCDKSKKLAKEKIIQGILLKKNIKGFLDLREILINLTHDSNLAQIYLCKANLLEEHEIIISADGIHLKCPMEENDSVSVMEFCYNQVDPREMNPPCRYLIDPYINVKIEVPEKATKIIKDLAQLEQSVEKQDSKTVDVEVIKPEEDEEKGDEE